LQDLSISPVPKQQLSYFGYQFEVPWNDIDDTQTKLYPHDQPTRDTMAVWSFSPPVHNRDNMLLLIKSVALSRNADGGIFTIQNPFFQGFQQGNLAATSDGCIFSLYSDTGRTEFALNEKNYKSRVSQVEVNRIMQSLCRVTAPLSAQETSARSN
jgi:hypothetical protein